MRTRNLHISFDKVTAQAKARVKGLSELKCKKLKEALSHGVADLTSKEEMDMYLSTYGDIHQEKLVLAFSKVPRAFMTDNALTVIDYGCGQGIASMVLCDVLRSIVGNPNNISEFYLIEPSQLCLMRAVKFIHTFNPKADIIYYNNPCEDVWRMDIQPKAGRIIHLLSNVLDIPDFPRQIIAQKLNSMTSHNNIIVCVSPFYQENGRAKHMDEFGNMLHAFRCTHSFEKHTDEWDKSFSCQMRIFVNKNYNDGNLT